MTDRPIIFSGPMVRALLDGRKSQTRRVIEPQPHICPELHEPTDGSRPIWCVFKGDEIGYRVRVPYAVGDWLWVRESGVQLGNAVDEGRERDGYEVCGFRYAADEATIFKALRGAA